MAYETKGLLQGESASVDGMLGSNQLTQEEINRLKRLYRQREGVMDTPDPIPNPIPKESRHYYDQYTPSTFGATVDMVHGSHPLWNEFGDRILQTFDEYGYKVDRKNLFPWDVQLSTSADRNLPYGTSMRQNPIGSPHADQLPIDHYEQQWLNANTGMNWQLRPDGLLASYGKFNPKDNHLAISRAGASASRDFYPGGIDPQTGELAVFPPWQNVTGHEYGHYLDWNLAGNQEGQGYLSDVLQNMATQGYNPQNTSREDLFNMWMNDPRTAHLNVVDKINTVDHPNQKLNNPREILGHLYTSAWVEAHDPNNPIRFNQRSGFPGGSMHESIARALGTFMDDQGSVEGHSQEIMDQRGSVMGALANILGQKREMIP